MVRNSNSEKVKDTKMTITGKVFFLSKAENKIGLKNTKGERNYFLIPKNSYEFFADSLREQKQIKIEIKDNRFSFPLRIEKYEEIAKQNKKEHFSLKNFFKRK